MQYKNIKNGFVIESKIVLDGVWEKRVKAEKSETPDGTWKVTDLKAYAETHGIDLGDATKKDDIIAAINAE